MDALRLAEVRAHLLAWQHRHPLARRIAAAQVQSIGYVALPFADDGSLPLPGAAMPWADASAASAAPAATGSLRDRAAARSKAQAEQGEHAGDASAPAADPWAAAAAEAAAQDDAAATPAELPPAGPAPDPAPPDMAPPAPAGPLLAADPGDAAPPARRGWAALRERLALAWRRPAPAAAADGWRRRAAALARFDEDFIPPLKAQRVAAFAAQHGALQAGEPAEAPLRLVRSAGAGPVRHLFLLTAAFEIDGQRHRVLLGSGARPQVLGTRPLARGRIAAAGMLAALVLATPLAGRLVPAASPDAPLAAAGAASAASAPAAVANRSAAIVAAPASGAAAIALAAPASTPASTPAVDTQRQVAIVLPASAPATVPAAVPAALASALPAVPANLPADAQRLAAAPPGTPTRSDGSLRPRLVPLLSDDEKAAARAQREALMKVRPAPPPEPVRQARADDGPAAGRAKAADAAQASTAAARPVAVPARAPVAMPAPGAAFAVTTRPLRTRAESQQVQVAMQALLATLGEDLLQVEVLPAGDDWRVVGFPFLRAELAQRARSLLAARGLRVEVVDF